ncbi:MAG: excinuclease ABC subunit UvrA [Candidatus Omnitrophica bacterium]|nr:excinuclease ABC subunit UvrA [Candidatus Omnitrophota bacterium]MCF7894335.1 excinuclease ABC subunit UvrA [Candidatus Omnitrophota bacterium]
MYNYITVKGAKEHNLQNINVKIPKNKITVVTGLSGSGKSSLAFDTIYAEGQRRYVESLSSYARQFLEQLQKPDIEHIEGLSPAIAIEQKKAGGSLRSIVATQTEIYDYLRLLYARIGKPRCPKCGRQISKQTPQQIIDQILKSSNGDKIFILSPIIRGKKGTYQALFEKLLKEGFSRIRVDKQIYNLDEKIKINRYKIHDIEILVDRIKISKKYEKRIASSVETALKYSEGYLLIYNLTKDKEFLFNTHLNCAYCQISFPKLEPRLFSFNSPYGACPACNGLGIRLEFDPDLIIPNKDKSLAQGAIEPFRRGSRGSMMYYRALLKELTYELDISMDTPFKKLSKKIQKTILYGNNDIYVWSKPYEGVIPHLERIFNKTESQYRKHDIANYMSKLSCPICKGMRLKKEALSVFVGKYNIWEVVQMNIKTAFNFFSQLKLTNSEEKIAHEIIKEIKKRLQFCLTVGLSYICLDRLRSTLSGGEAQRIRLATQVGSALSGVIYILDEPTIGLHPRDDKNLIKTLEKLKRLGNTVIVVEHDKQMIHAADHIIDLGPGAGVDGGKVVYSGKINGIKKSKSLTGQYLSQKKEIKTPKKRRDYKNKSFLEIKGASEHNLKRINIKFPLESFICVTGVSGSGKSTLVDDILYRALAKNIYNSRLKPGKFKKINGLKNIDKVIIVDQSPIGRTPRSNPATYTGVLTPIRDLFAKLPEARARGFKKSRFSFNLSGGRCQACRGEGTKKIEMHFLPDIYIPCEVCQGKRFNKQTLEVKYKGNDISNILDMDIDQAYQLFHSIPSITNILKTVKDVGLGYIKLGQPATTLSGGEAQRIKLASQLRKKATGKTLYILDEPTTGLHFEDIKKLLFVLQKLVDKKNTICVIEHNLDVIKCADYIIDLGPEGGENGGKLVSSGTPEKISKSRKSYTGNFLKKILN